MALKREMLKALGLNDEQIQTIIEGHDETVQALKKERDDYKAKAANAEALKAENGELKKQIEAAKGGTDWKAEYDKLKADTEAKESLANVKAAYRKLLKDAKIDDDVLDAVMDATKFDGMKLDKDGALHDADKLTEAINSRWAKFVVTEGKRATPAKTPPEGNGTAFESMNLTDKMVYANQHPNDPAVTAWLANEQPATNKPPKNDNTRGDST